MKAKAITLGVAKSNGAITLLDSGAIHSLAEQCALLVDGVTYNKELFERAEIWTSDLGCVKSYHWAQPEKVNKLVITVKNATMSEEGETPLFEYVVTGLIAGDIASEVLQGTPVFEVYDGDASIDLGNVEEGEYTLKVSGFTSSKYDIEYVDGILTVTE